MAYDFKKEFRELYRPSGKPSVVTVPPMSYVAVRGKGDPSAEGGEYQNALPLLYGVAYAIKMSKKGSREIEGYFDFVVPPLEGFWWQDRADGEIDYARKDDFNFISCIRLPDFVTREDFDWAVSEAAVKKKLDFSAVELLGVDEGLMRSVHACRALRRRAGDHKMPCAHLRRNGVTPPTSPKPVSITRFTSPTRASARQRSSRP